MKFLASAAAAVPLAFLCSCANEGPTGEEVQEQFRRGLSGEGRLGPIDRSDDPYVREREPLQPITSEE